MPFKCSRSRSSRMISVPHWLNVSLVKCWKSSARASERAGPVHVEALYFSILHFVNSAISSSDRLVGVHPRLHLLSRLTAESSAAGDGVAIRGFVAEDGVLVWGWLSVSSMLALVY